MSANPEQRTLDIDAYVDLIGYQARQAAKVACMASTQVKNQALQEIALAILGSQEQLLEANTKDMEAARQTNLESALLDRLQLTPARVVAMAEGVAAVAALPDLVGEITDLKYRPSGIQVGRMRVPLGVIGIIYESRPNVTVDAAALCLKAGNAVILRGGSEALHSNLAIAACIRHGLAQAELPADVVQVVETTDRRVVGRLIAMPQYVDVIVPRGGRSLIQRISSEARVPVIKHLDGVCHVYIDDHADLEKAISIALNAKTQRYGTCNTMETLLISTAVAEQILPHLARLFLDAGVELRGCVQTRALVPEVRPASEDDWYAEYLAPILAIRVVEGLTQAIEHISQYGSHHTDAIVTQDLSRAQRFMREVDSSSVMINASTRFADGYEYGLGAEIGISTDKLHARGPVGLEGLTSQKWVVFGDGHVRS